MREMTVTDITSGLLDEHAIAKVLRCSRRQVHRYWNEANGLPYVKLGRKRYTRLSVIPTWLESRERQSNPPRKRRRAA